MKNYISWATGGFTESCWHTLYKVIRGHNVKTVLEYGCGVSTEMMLAIELDVTSLETQQDYLLGDGKDQCGNVILCTYPLFPAFDRKFDLAFIDGPGAREFEVARKAPERTQSAVHAIKYADLIILHDGGLGQIEPLLQAGFTQIPPGFSGVGARNILFQRKAAS